MFYKRYIISQEDTTLHSYNTVKKNCMFIHQILFEFGLQVHTIYNDLSVSSIHHT